MNPSHFMALALIAGVSVPLQAGLNALVARGVGSATGAAAVNFAVGLAVLAAAVLVLRLPLPLGAALAGVPAYAWTAGIVGAFFVTAIIAVAPVLGAASMVGFIVAGQMLASLVLDHFGWLGFPEQPVTPWRMLGAVMLVGGVVLIRRF